MYLHSLNQFTKVLFLILAFFLSFSFKIYSQRVSSAEGHNLIVCAEGKVLGWGSNMSGQLGNNTIIDSSTPYEAMIDNVVQVEASQRHGVNYHFGASFALKSDGTVWSWGSNSFHLGYSTFNDILIPTQIPNLTNVKSIAMADYTNLPLGMALKLDGTVWVWGNGMYGGMGNGTTQGSAIPIQVPTLNHIKEIACSGAGNAAALDNYGTVWTWGYGGSGLVGDSTYNDKLLAGPLSSLNNVISISAGAAQIMALKNDGTVWAWGLNNIGQLGDGTTQSWNFPVQIIISDVKKIFSGNNFFYAIKNDNTLWAWGINNYGQLGDGTNINKTTPQQLFIDGVLDISPGYNHTLALKDDGTIWAWGDNSIGQLGDSILASSNTPILVQNTCYVPSPEIKYDHYLTGNIYYDLSNDCINQISELKFSKVLVVANPGSIYSCTDSIGNYIIGVNDSSNYTISPIINPSSTSMISSVCPINYDIFLTDSNLTDTSGFDFGLTGNPCHILKVDVHGSRKRRCMAGQTVVNFSNEGLIPAYNVSIHIKFDQYDIPVSSNHTFTIDQTDSSLVFLIDSINVHEYGSIIINDSIACVTGIDSITQCTKAWILPVNQCLIDSTTGANWDHSSIIVDGRCIFDTIQFKIKNTGNSMLTSSQYRIYQDNVLSQTDTFQLISNDSLILKVLSMGATIRLEADQTLGHPGTSLPRSTIEGCGTNLSGTFSVGQVNRAQMDDIDPDVEIDCIVVTGSFDPNDKQNSPTGIGENHLISPGSQIEYVVRFQNTGSDTAFTVIIIDTLSSNFDISTLEFVSASHQYEVSITGVENKIINYRFDDILLPDSSTDEINSHGYIKYKIYLSSSIPIGTRINNSADIFFDFNFPVRTNESFVTIGDTTSLSVLELSKFSNSNIVIYPNPFTSSISIETKNGIPIDKIEVFSIEGKLVHSKIYDGKSLSTIVELHDLTPGCYFINCKYTFFNEMVRVIKF